MNKFKPLMYKKNIFKINYNKLKESNIKLLAIDLDNTTLPFNEIIPSDDTITLINKLKKEFIIVITSNNRSRRVKKVANYLKCDYFSDLRKPSKKIKKLIENKYNISMDYVSIIGDQIVTDILLGNRLGSYTVLVDPLIEKDLVITKFNRVLEKIIMKIIKLKRGNYYE